MAQVKSVKNDPYLADAQKTYHAFLRFTFISLIAVIVLLAGMAIFLV